jgi:hypothetical protein
MAWGQYMAEMVKFPSKSSILYSFPDCGPFHMWQDRDVLYICSNDYGCTCMGRRIQMVGSVCNIIWDIYIFLFRKMGFGHQEDVYFLGVEKYFFYALGQLLCISRCCELFY